MKINMNLCDICGTCISVCPVDAIKADEFRVVIDENQCIECGKCKIVCPARAIDGEVK